MIWLSSRSSRLSRCCVVMRATRRLPKRSRPWRASRIRFGLHCWCFDRFHFNLHLARVSQLVLAYNSASMQKLAQEDSEQAHLLLVNAQTMLNSSTAFLAPVLRRQLLSVTYNNCACLFKRQNDLSTALGYAERALLLERQDPSAPNPASTHLNLCAILSEMGRHTSAHEQALYALRCVVLWISPRMVKL